MVTNIIRKKLIDYTKIQCNLWGIETKSGETLPYWDENDEQWVYSEDKLLIIDNREVLLVPKAIVSRINIYAPSKYNWHFILDQERDFHLQRNSSLVKYKNLKDGTVKPYLPKKDVNSHVRQQINRGEYLNTKEYIREYTRKHPELFQKFVDNCKRNVKSLSNKEIANYLEDCDIDQIIDNLIDTLRSIPVGKNHASQFHRTIKSLLEIIFYPNLINPIVEKEIHDGRKRIDIVMDNNARNGFFFDMHYISKIFCPYVYIECKNYGKDVANPEIDQLSGRFSTNRGQFGILICRDLEDEKLFNKRCIDTYQDSRGLIICLADYDIIKMLEYIKKEEYNEIGMLLNNKKREIMVG